MATKIVMTALSQTMERGRLLEWHVAVGDSVKVGTPLLSIETDKATVEVESPIEGTVLSIVGEIETEYTIGDVLAWIGEAGEIVPGIKNLVGREREVTAARITPVALKLAQRHHADIIRIEGTGPSHTITKQDVLRYLEENSEHAEPHISEDREEDFTLVTRSIVRWRTSEKLATSWRDTPQVSESLDVDFSRVFEIRAQKMADWETQYHYPPTLNDFLVKAAALALGSYPELNVTSVGQTVRQHRAINICVAVDTAHGLLAPVVQDVGSKSLFAIARVTKSLVQKARDGSLTPDELAGGTFTISNLGPFGIDWFTPLVNPPQAAILGVGSIKKKVVVHRDEIAIRDMTSAIVTFDHRLLDGALVAKFLDNFRSRIEMPEMLMQ